MSSSVVCGVDHSAHSREAARFAADLTERLRLRLVMHMPFRDRARIPLHMAGAGVA